jgi:tetratricopeptide (TPR) repeat protein
MLQHKHAEAAEHYQEVLRLNPNDPRAHQGLGNALAEQGKLEEAIQQFTEALRLRPDYPEARRQLESLSTRTGH